MGTSTSYDAPPSWRNLKGDVTRAASDRPLTPASARKILRSFIAHNGGTRAVARGVGGGGVVARGHAARRVASRLGGFISDIGRLGLDGALRNAGWSDLVGRSVQEIFHAIVDRLSGESSTLDDVDARMALSKLQEQYFAAATTPEELERLLNAQVDRLDSLLQEFFGFYLYEVFCRVFFERLMQRIGEARAYSFLNEIRDFIRSTLANRATNLDLERVNWNGADGQAIVQDIMETTFSVFGG